MDSNSDFGCVDVVSYLVYWQYAHATFQPTQSVTDLICCFIKAEFICKLSYVMLYFSTPCTLIWFLWFDGKSLLYRWDMQGNLQSVIVCLVTNHGVSDVLNGGFGACTSWSFVQL